MSNSLPNMPPVQYVQTNGVRLAYYESGPRQGIPVIFCHGWPELAFSWRHQLKALGEAGRWAVAPDQRHALARLQRKGRAIQQGHVPEGEMGVGEGQQGHGGIVPGA